MEPRTQRKVALALALAAICAAAPGCRRDLALHKPVHASSVVLGAPEGAVNGFVEWGSLAVATRHGSTAWLDVDLEDTFRLDEVRVFGRGDGYYVEGYQPMDIEIAGDDGVFKHAGKCEAIVTQASPCRVALRGATARHVRVTHPTHLAISEIEAFGAR
jgi:hypothetical protein